MKTFLTSFIILCTLGLSAQTLSAVEQAQLAKSEGKNVAVSPAIEVLYAKFALNRFPIGSILSSSIADGDLGDNYFFANTQNSEQIKGVFDVENVSGFPVNNTADINLILSEKAKLFQRAVVTDNITHVRYNLQNGHIQKGDYITISNEPGVGMKATESGFTVGVALENSDAAEKPGLLKIRVMVRYEKF